MHLVRNPFDEGALHRQAIRTRVQFAEANLDAEALNLEAEED